MELLLPNMTTTLMPMSGMLVALPCLQIGRADRCAMGQGILALRFLGPNGFGDKSHKAITSSRSHWMHHGVRKDSDRGR